MTAQPGTIRRLWYNWKMMKLPWRKRWLVGFDLEGNTFWEFKDALNAQRYRRIVKYSRSTHHSDVNVAPHWMQWLRHTRYEAPTIAEQQADVLRQERMKMLAAQADARWSMKPSALDSPDKQQPMHMLESRDQSRGIKQMNLDQEMREQDEQPRSWRREKQGNMEGNDESTPIPQKAKTSIEPKATLPKQAAASNPSGEWQPESWVPSPARNRRG